MSNAPQVSGERAAQRLMRSLDYRMTREIEPLNKEQVAVVLRALADHTALVQATQHDPDSDPATSTGRWLHAVADDLTGFYDAIGAK